MYICVYVVYVCEHIIHIGLQLGDTSSEDRIFKLLQNHCHTVDQLLADRRHRLQDTLSYHQFCNQANDLDLWIDDEVCTYIVYLLVWLHYAYVCIHHRCSNRWGQGGQSLPTFLERRAKPPHFVMKLYKQFMSLY